MLLAAISLAIADAVTTYLGITSGVAEEANPAAAWTFDKVGLVPGLILTSVMFVIAVWAATRLMVKHLGKSKVMAGLASLALIVILAGKALAVINNVAVLT